MIDNIVKRHRVVLLISILLLGFVLRLHNFTTWPREGATFDEYAWTWLGVNLIQKGTPISWSPHPQYKNRTHYVSPGGARFWLVQPYLEHPPLFGVIAGGYALLRGAPDMYNVLFSYMRELALFLGILAIFMVYLLATSLYGVSVGLVTAFLYAIIPTVVIGSRILENENFFIPLFLAILLCMKKYLDSGRMRMLVLASVLCGLAILSKIPWIAATVACVGILIYKRKIHEIVLLSGIVFTFFSLYILYGIYWDRELFFSLWKLQLNRYDMMFDSVFALFQQPYLVDRYYTDGYIYAGWTALIAMLVSDIRRHYILIFGLLGYMAIYLLGIPNEPSHGWYRYPIYPFLVMALGWYLTSQRKTRILTSLMLLGITLSLLAHTWGQVLGFSYYAYRAVVVWYALSTIPVFFPGRKAMKFTRWNTMFQLLAITVLSVWSVIIYNEN